MRRPRRTSAPRTPRAQASGDHEEVHDHRDGDERAREDEPDRDGEGDGDVREQHHRRGDDARDHLIDGAQDRPQRLGRVALEPHQLGRARVADQEPRDQVGLRRVRRPHRQPQTDHREDAADDEERRGDHEQDQRRPVAVGLAKTERLDHRPGDPGRPLVAEQVDQRVDENERERVETGDEDAVDRDEPETLALARPDERPGPADAVDETRRPPWPCGPLNMPPCRPSAAPAPCRTSAAGRARATSS